MSKLEDALEQVRIKQNKQIAEYSVQTPIGQPIELARADKPPVRLLLNFPKQRPESRMKVYINLHGGGFIEGDAVQMGTLCQKIADRLGILCVNINYRLSPDYVYPYQCEEIEAARAYLTAHADELNIDPERVGIGGFSAGATLTLNTVVRALQRGENAYRCCVLGYPLVSADWNENDAASPDQACDELMASVIGYYYAGNDALPECSALNADDALLARFPSVIEITCGRDSLSRQGRKFAGRLAQNGVRLNYIQYNDAKHGFIEVNRPDYLPEDFRKTPDQAALCARAEEFIIDGLASLL